MRLLGKFVGAEMISLVVSRGGGSVRVRRKIVQLSDAIMGALGHDATPVLRVDGAADYMRAPDATASIVMMVPAQHCVNLHVAPRRSNAHSCPMWFLAHPLFYEGNEGLKATNRGEVVEENLEHRAGIEPANTGFADQRVSHFATGAHPAASSEFSCENSSPAFEETILPLKESALPQNKNPTLLTERVGYLSLDFECPRSCFRSIAQPTQCFGNSTGRNKSR